MREHRLGGLQCWSVCRVAQQRLADALSEDARLAARGAEQRPGALAAVGLALVCAQTSLAAIEAQAKSRRGRELDPKS